MPDLTKLPVNLMTILVAAIVVLFVLQGYRKGMIRKLSGIIALVISTLLVSVFLPNVTSYMKTSTPVYGFIEQQCEKTVSKLITDALLGDTKQDESSIDIEHVRYLMNYYGMDSSILDAMNAQELDTYVRQYFPDYYATLQEGVTVSVNSLTKNEQTRVIQRLPIPEFLKNMMLTYNNSEGYRKLAVSSFTGYIVSFFANVILNIVAFLATLLIVQLVVWLVLTALGVFARLPFLNIVNHLGGMVVGAVQGLIVVWMLFLVISILSGTPFGMEMMNLIDSSKILKPLYQSNLFLKLVAGAISRIM